MDDVSGGLIEDDVGMRIQIHLDGFGQLAGRISAPGGGGEVVRFEGWLGLVGALFDVLGLDDGGRPTGIRPPGRPAAPETTLAPERRAH